MQSPFAELFINEVTDTVSETADLFINPLLDPELVYEHMMQEHEHEQDQSFYNSQAEADMGIDTAQQMFENESFFTDEVNVPKAARNNPIYAEKLNWKYFDLEIYSLLGYTDTSPDEEAFAYAVADWQVKNNLIPADGTIGPFTWSTMFTEIINGSTFKAGVIASAIPVNERLKKQVGWDVYTDRIYEALGFHQQTPSAEYFAKAVLLWQSKLGFSGNAVDGKLGANTWAKLKVIVLKQIEEENQILEKPALYEAVIKAPAGIYLHTKPKVSTKQTNKLYTTGEKVMVIAESTLAAEAGWRKIQASDGNTGWIEMRYLIDISPDNILLALSKPPSPYIVKPGDKLDKLVMKFYPDYKLSIGNDRRTIVHAFNILNSGRSSIRYVGKSDTWWRDHVFDRDMAATRTIYETIELMAGKHIYFPSETYIKFLRDNALVGVRPDWKNATIVAGKSVIGFLEGVGQGFIDSGIDLVKGLRDLIKNIVTGELFSQLYDLYKEFEKYTLEEALGKVWDLIKSIVGDKVDTIKKEFNLANPYRRFYSIGKLVGYLLFEIVLFIFTSGTSLAAKFAVKFAKLIELLSKSSALGRIARTANRSLPAVISGWEKLDDLNNLAGAGTALFQAIDQIEDVYIEGGELDLSGIQEEAEEVFESIPYEEQQVAVIKGDEAEALVAQLLRDGDPLLTSQGIPLFDHIISGQYNPQKNGIDFFGFTVKGNKVSIYIIEVKGGKYPRLGTPAIGRQMEFAWLEDAIDQALKNPALKAQLKEALKHYYGGNPGNEQIKKLLLKANRKVMVSRHAFQQSIDRLQKLLKKRSLRKVRLVHFESAEEMNDTNVNAEAEVLWENQVSKKAKQISVTFSGKQFTILDVASNAAATVKNQKLVTQSGLALADILAALAAHADADVIRKLLEQQNGLSIKLYSLAANGTIDAVFTEVIHQFQQAHYINAAEQDGIMGASTLDTLGLAHTLSPVLQSAGYYGQRILNKIDSQISRETGSKYNSRNWFRSIRRPAWLGVKITSGIHELLLEKLKVAEAWLKQQPQYSGMTPADIGRALGFTAGTSYSSGRFSASREAMHGFGLAIDIDVKGNPWIGAGWSVSPERNRMLEAFRLAAGDRSLRGAHVLAYLHDIALTTGNYTSASYNTLKQRHDEFISYLNTHRSELTYWQRSQTFRNRDPLRGFLNLHHDLVYALRQIAGLAWGAIDFGPNACGDIMHFDLRVTGVGPIIARNWEPPYGYVPSANHPALSTSVQNEHESPDLSFETEEEFEVHEADR